MSNILNTEDMTDDMNLKIDENSTKSCIEETKCANSKKHCNKLSPNEGDKENDDIKLQEDENLKHSPLEKTEQNDLSISKEKESCLETTTTTKSTSTKGKQLLCSMYSDTDSDPDCEVSLKSENKGILCSVYSDSESDETIQKENIEKNVKSVLQLQGIDDKFLNNEPKKIIDSQSSSHFLSGINIDNVDTENDYQNVGNDMKISTVTKSNNKEPENKIDEESSLSALTNNEIEVENPEKEKDVENEKCNKFKDFGDSCLEPVNEHDGISTSNDKLDISKEVNLRNPENIEKDTSISFKPNEDATKDFYITTAEEMCDKSDTTSKDTEQLYKEFYKIIEEEDKESAIPENVIENKIEKIIIPNWENFVFRNFSINLTDLESTMGFKPVNILQDFDVSLTEWATLLVSQLSVRDELICILHNSIEKLVQKGTSLEQDVDYQQIKLTELQQQIKKKKRKLKHKSCQTNEEELLKSWKGYYEQSSKANTHSFPQQVSNKDQWPSHYGAQASVVHSSVLQHSSTEKESSVTENVDNTVVNEYDNFIKDVNKNISDDKLMSNISSKECERKDSSTNESIEDVIIKKEVKITKPQESGNNTNQSTSESCTKIDAEKITTHNIKTNNSKPNSVVSSSVSNTTIRNDTSQKLIDEVKDQPTDPSSISGTEDLIKCDSHGWDKSENIADQVIAAATQIVEGSGYVFDQETGLYYDYNSGYYYNAETGLYYDSNSGTYFYYDHSTQAYQFHSQVIPENTENILRKKKKRKIKNIEEGLSEEAEKHVPIKKKKCKIKKEANEEKEDGECSESEESSNGFDEVSEEEEEESSEEMEKDVGGDFNEEEIICQSEVPPSLRLMVIESEAKRVTVGSLHMVTVDGGTAGRDPNSIVHLQDISISKVHAGFSYHSNGPSDHHYYVRDLGSNNGTFVNAIRLSDPRQESQEKELGHGWLLRLGQVTLKCHIHPGALTCNECEPGLVAKNANNKKEGSGYKSVKSREKARKKEMKALRKKYALSWTDQPPPMNPEYKDRAEKRRIVIGSDNPYEKTEVASSDIAITSKNKGFKMLEKMGWTEGQGLGKITTGLIEPIQPESAVGRSGLGCMQIPVPETTTAQANRKKILSVTQKRFNKL